MTEIEIAGMLIALGLIVNGALRALTSTSTLDGHDIKLGLEAIAKAIRDKK